jgi:FKBP-type peptidyl-prolyl cis-trans isomerase FkpA
MTSVTLASAAACALLFCGAAAAQPATPPNVAGAPSMAPKLVSDAAAAPAAKASGAAATETLPSGVKVTHTRVGTGESPTAASRVKVHYEGTLTNGTVFDSSYKRGEPITFGLNQVIPCWTQGVQKMKVGGKATLNCPSDTAYGARAVGGAIPANSNLVFVVELLGIEKVSGQEPIKR